MTAPSAHSSLPSGALHVVALPIWQQRGVYVSLGVLSLTGVAWLAAHGLLSEFEPKTLACKLWAIRVHAAAALVSLVMAGSVLTHHIRLAWRLRKNRWSGAVMTAALALLAGSGYALGYAPEGMFRQGSSWLHWGVGLLLPVVVVSHVWLGQRRRSAGR